MVGKNLPANAADMGSDPGPRRFHMPRSNWACALEPLSLEPMLHNKRIHHEKPMHHN